MGPPPIRTCNLPDPIRARVKINQQVLRSHSASITVLAPPVPRGSHDDVWSERRAGVDADRGASLLRSGKMPVTLDSPADRACINQKCSTAGYAGDSTGG